MQMVEMDQSKRPASMAVVKQELQRIAAVGPGNPVWGTGKPRPSPQRSEARINTSARTHIRCSYHPGRPCSCTASFHRHSLTKTRLYFLYLSSTFRCGACCGVVSRRQVYCLRERGSDGAGVGGGLITRQVIAEVQLLLLI